jgi:hypothetical protein
MSATKREPCGSLEVNALNNALNMALKFIYAGLYAIFYPH